MQDCSTWTVPERVFNERLGDFSLPFFLLSFCKLILKYFRESKSSFNNDEGNVLHFSTWEISRLLSNNICRRDSWVWDFVVEFNKIAAFQTKHKQQQTCGGICSLKCPFFNGFHLLQFQQFIKHSQSFCWVSSLITNPAIMKSKFS